MSAIKRKTDTNTTPLTAEEQAQLNSLVRETQELTRLLARQHGIEIDHTTYYNHY